MEKEGTYYKKIVTWKKNKEPPTGLYFGLLLLGIAMGWCLKIIVPNIDNLIGITLFVFFGIGFCIVDYFCTHDRNVKYEKYEVKKN